jgi:O-antigen ligase
MGPHSIFFEAGFAGGVPAMALLGGLLGVILHRGTQRLPSLADARDQRLLVAALCALVAFYLVRGMVESVRWGPLGIVLAVVLPLTCCVDTKRQPDRPPPGTADAP